MSDSLLRNEPVGTAPIVGKGVTIGLAPPMARYSLRTRDPQVLERALGRSIPRQIGAIEGPVACLGPDEWLLRVPFGTPALSAADQTVSIVDISDRAVCLMVEGPCAAQALMAGCPLDLDRLAVGRATRTLFETVEIVILRTDDRVLEVEVWRSFAPWLQASLEQVASDLH